MKSYVLLAALLVIPLCGGCSSFEYGYNHADYASRMLSTQAKDGQHWMALEKACDATIRGYVAGHGEPDYLYTPNMNELYLIYLQPEKFVRCKRSLLSPDSRLEEIDTLPSDLQAQIQELNPSNASAPGGPVAVERGRTSDELVLIKTYADGKELPAPDARAALQVKASGGDPNAQYELGLCYLVEGDLTEMAKWFEKAAEQGHVRAESALGECHSLGAGVPTDTAKAISLWSKASEQGDLNSWYNLAEAYRKGNGVERDCVKATELYRQAAEKGHTPAQFCLGQMYEKADCAAPNDVTAAFWYRKAAEQDHSSAQQQLGLMYRSGRGVAQNYTEAANWLRRAADAGGPESQFTLGLMYLRGEGTEKDYNEAAEWLTKAAKQGHAEAIEQLRSLYYPIGWAYYSGTEGVQQDFNEAAKWLTKGAEQEDVLAQALLGYMYYRGQGVQQDYAKAARWFLTPAEDGNISAQCLLGSMYRHGQGVRQNYTEAMKWFSKAAEQGDSEAQRILGAMYEQGEGVSPNYRTAAIWYKKAAEQGNAAAQFQLALLYAQGKGVLEDYVEAYKWALVAAMNGFDADDQALKNWLRQEMTPAQIGEAQRRARAFIDPRDGKSPENGQSQEEMIALATGFLITGDGYLLTAQHAIERASRVEVLHQQRTYPARVIIKDEAIDVAVLKIEGAAFPRLPLVSSATVKTGDVVFTMGFPQVSLQGPEPKYTDGSISSLSGLGGSSRFFQISVPVQPGNSGGPLLNERGQVIGVVNARLNDSFAVAASGMIPQNVNYAVKSSFILPVLEGIEGLSAQVKARGESASERSVAIERTKQALVMVVCY